VVLLLFLLHALHDPVIYLDRNVQDSVFGANMVLFCAKTVKKEIRVLGLATLCSILKACRRNFVSNELYMMFSYSAEGITSFADNLINRVTEKFFCVIPWLIRLSAFYNDQINSLQFQLCRKKSRDYFNGKHSLILRDIDVSSCLDQNASHAWRCLSFLQLDEILN